MLVSYLTQSLGHDSWTTEKHGTRNHHDIFMYKPRLEQLLVIYAVVDLCDPLAIHRKTAKVFERVLIGYLAIVEIEIWAILVYWTLSANNEHFSNWTVYFQFFSPNSSAKVEFLKFSISYNNGLHEWVILQLFVWIRSFCSCIEVNQVD